MSNYNIQISWSGKDALSDSDPAKVISGADFQTEFAAVQTAVNSKAELAGSSSQDFNTNDLAVAGDLTVTGSVSGIESIPAGVVVPYISETEPSGWLKCDGSAVSRTTYSDLFAVIGTSFGTGDGSTTFNLPDLQGRTIVGSGSGSGLTSRTLAASGGAETDSHTLTLDEIPAHTHTYRSNEGNGTAQGGCCAQGDVFATVNSGSSGGGSAHTHDIMQPFLVLNYMIKTQQQSVPL